MNYLHLALIPLLLIIGGVIYYFTGSWEEFYDEDKLLADPTDKLEDLEDEEEQHGKKEDQNTTVDEEPEGIDDGEEIEREKQKTPEEIKKEKMEETKRRNSMLLRLAGSLTKHPVASQDILYAKFYLKSTQQIKDGILKNCLRNFGEFGPLGIALLSTNEKEKLPEYLEFVEDMIKTIDAELNKIPINGKKVPYNQDWYNISVLLTRLLATYEILGSDKVVKDICHRRILQITPKINVSLGVIRTGIELVWIAVPYLITTNLFAKDICNAEIHSKCDDLNAFLRNDTYSSDESPQGFANGFYKDGSFLHNNVATYKPLIDLQMFYLEILRELGFPTEIEKRIKDVCNSMLHKDMDFVPFAVFGPASAVTYQQAIVQFWPDFSKVGDYNTQIFPVIGLGVFKSSDFFFSVRVQQNDIVAFVSNDSMFEFNLGFIQIRKLYMKGVNYGFEEPMTFDQLKKQPGVISLNGNSSIVPVRSGEVDLVRRYSATVTESCIGHFEIKNKGSVLYWMQKYTFNYWEINMSITEYGVCTDDGLVMRHHIINRCKTSLMIQVVDQNMDPRFKSDFYSEGLNLTNGGYDITTTKPVVISSRYVLNEDLKVDFDKTENCMKFEIGEKTFYVKGDGDISVVIDKKDGPFIASGYSIWKKTHVYNYNGKQVEFIYNPVTKMFQKN